MIFLFFGLQMLQIFNFMAESLQRNCVGSAHQGQGGPCSVTTSISNEEILSMGQQLWNSDEYRVQVGLNLQGKVGRSKTDQAMRPLCNNIPKEIANLTVYNGLISLFDNYIADDTKREEITATERDEMEAFLDTVIRTGTFRILHEFLAAKGLVSEDAFKFRETIRNMWYSPYKRSKVLSSSGAEHILIGEVKDDKVSGMHSWVRYCLLEKNKNINYLGYEKILDLNGAYLLQASFLWDNHLKSGGSFFVGTSPAFDLSIFTFCFFARPNQKCRLKINGHVVRVQTYYINYDRKKMIASAYPEF